MIYGFFGDVGSGKTLTMTKYGFLFYKLGYNVYSNYHLNFPHTKVNKEFLKNIVENDVEFEGDNIFLLDEIGMYMDSRRSSSEGNVLISYFVKQVRKKRIKLLYTEQMRHAVDRRLRGLTRSEIVCKTKTINVYMGNDKELNLVFVYNNVFCGDVLVGKRRMLGNKYFNLYDTKELITT